VGKGNIRELLLSHWNHEKPSNLAIWSRNPAPLIADLTGLSCTR